MVISGNKELKLLDKASREFAKKELAPKREENDQYPFGPFFQKVLEKAFELDFFHVTLPEDLGGIGHGLEALCIILDNICREDSSLGGIIFTVTLAQEILLAAGENEILGQMIEKQKSVEDCLIACPILCNPSEVELSARADRSGDDYSLSGSVEYLILGSLAKTALVPALADDKTGYSFFLLDITDPAVAISDPVMSHGLHACPAVDVSFNKAPAMLVGSSGKGHEYFQKAAAGMQLAAAAMSCGIMQGSFDEAMAYCAEREQGGRKTRDWSEMQMLLSDMAVKVTVADMLVSRACQAVENQEKGWENFISAASLHIQSAATALVTDGIQALGGVGYMKDFGQEKRFRDAGQVQAFLGMEPMKRIRFIENF
jgi:alkylation response protein AidB-like acyl-CoA dehydrogenase